MVVGMYLDGVMVRERRPRLSRVRRAAFLSALAASIGFAGLVAAPVSAANNPGTGDSGFFTFRPSEDVGGTQINVASGNALIRTQDLVDGPLTYHVVVDRAYNSLSPDTFTILSPRWGFDVGPDTKLTVESNQDATVRGPSGYRIRFARQTDGSYVAPEGFDGTLTKTPSGWTLSRTSQNDQLGFDGSGNLTSTKDSSARDFTVQGTSAAGRTVLSSYGTNSGRRVNLSYTGDSLVRLMDDPASGHHSYRYTAGRLTEYESPTGAITTYGYDSNGFLDEIVEPGGTTVDLDVLSSGKVNTITTTLPGGVPQTTSFVYTRRTYKSDVTAPDTSRRTYAYDDDWRVTRHYDPDVVPTVSVEGPLRDAAGGFVDGEMAHVFSYDVQEPDGAGITEVRLLDSAAGALSTVNPPCTTTPFDVVCPQAFNTVEQMSFHGVPEGIRTLHAEATDDEGNVGSSETWSVGVDRTAPLFDLGGNLYTDRTTPIGSSESRTLSISASDGDPTGGPESRRAGVAWIAIFADGDLVKYTDQTSSGNSVGLASAWTDTERILASGGGHLIRVVVADRVGHQSEASFFVGADDVAPNTVSGLDASFSEDDGVTSVSWNEATDPESSNGDPGSGVAAYRYRHRTLSGSWGPWTLANDATFELSGRALGASVRVQVVAIDQAGNTGAAQTETLTSSDTGPTPNDPGEGADDTDGIEMSPEPENLSVAVDRQSLPSPVPSTELGAAVSIDGRVVASSAYTERQCPDTGPCGTFDRYAAGRYARKWNLLDAARLDKRENPGDPGDRYQRNYSNNDYRYFGGAGGDCTNYVSQVLKAGGMRYMRSNGRNTAFADGKLSAYEKGEGSWWSWYNPKLHTPVLAGVYDYGNTESFVRVKPLRDHLVDYGLATRVLGTSKLRTGDIIFINLDGNGEAGINHTQVVSRVTSKSAYISQHSPAYRKPLAAVKARLNDDNKVQGVDWNWYIYRPVKTAANITE